MPDDRRDSLVEEIQLCAQQADGVKNSEKIPSASDRDAAANTDVNMTESDDHAKNTLANEGSPVRSSCCETDRMQWGRGGADLQNKPAFYISLTHVANRSVFHRLYLVHSKGYLTPRRVVRPLHRVMPSFAYATLSSGNTEKPTTICAYCKQLGEARRNSCTEPHTCGKLSKPPKYQSPRKRPPRNKLQKRGLTPSEIQLPPIVYILQYEPYPYKTSPGSFLGVFSNFNKVTTGAILNGAFTFSREGLLDGNEYLNSTGRIKILSTQIEREGVEIPLPSPIRDEDSIRERGGSRRGAGSDRGSHPSRKVYLAVYKSPTETVCIGAFSRKKKAWGACLKDQTKLSSNTRLQEITRLLDENDLPTAKGRIPGDGWYHWTVEEYDVDKATR
ncbi:hypothetical protein BS50DRAFT_615685 [Corynespora cassiicola Philippines]|uniref:Uncharacterized protein n=1 Tax=Corynespora cassiicola Philippines TaxID=1448308 RepID=A0A2T2PB49_CORCC|nr:hypothetical protein BS50DRAFT_615685 [Corynespora cassiicola Philippines]